MPKKNKKQTVAGMEQLIATSPNAQKRYDIADRFEAGVVLTGSEVKSLRAGRGDLEGAYAAIDQNEAWLYKMHVAPYEQAGPYGHDPKRKRKLLLHRREIEKLRGRIAQQGYALVPTKVYFRSGVVKVELGLGRGKKLHDDREAIKKKIDLREAREASKRR